MDLVHLDLLGPFAVEDRWRAVEAAVLRRHLRGAGGPAPVVAVAGVLGRWLSRAGGRLEAVARPRPAPLWVPGADPCRGCAN